MDNGFVLEGLPHGYSHKEEVGNKSRRHRRINDTAVLWYQLPSFDFSKAAITGRTEKCHTAVFTYDDVVLIVTPKHNVATQVFKDSIGIWVGDGAHRKGWNRNQQIVKHNRFRSRTCGRVLKERNFGERQAIRLFNPSP